jgi:membrane protease YdiL (CAAX protease family)
MIDTPVRPSEPRAATFPARRPWLTATAFALVPVAFTAAASAIGQGTALGAVAAALVVAGGAAVSTAVGLLVIGRSRDTAGEYGFRRARRASAAWWFLPIPATVATALATQGVHVGWPQLAAYAVLAVAVAVNEEVWFRGIILAVLRPRGVRVAVVGSSALFGVLHLANLASGQDLAVSVLQVAFAVVFGLVAAELVVVTGSIWPVIGWHAGWDFVNYLGGNATTQGAVVGIGVAVAVMVAYAAAMWHVLPRGGAESAPGRGIS